jgi:hypothetical protein
VGSVASMTQMHAALATPARARVLLSHSQEILPMKGRRSADRRAFHGPHRRMRPRARILRPPPLAGEGWEGARSPLGAPPRLWSQRERCDPIQAALHASERMRALPAPSFALKRGTSRTGHNAGGDDARTARERGYKPRPQEPHSLHVQVCLENTPFDERDWGM